MNQHVAIIRLKRESEVGVDTRYLESCLVSLKDELIKEAVKGSTRKALTKEFLINFEIPIPPLPTQRKIVAKLDAVRERCEKLKRAAEEGLQTAALMRKAILKEAFA